MGAVLVGRFDNNKRVELATETASINNALTQGGFTKADNEEIQDLQGTVYTGVEHAVAGSSYFLVQRVKSGDESR